MTTNEWRHVFATRLKKKMNEKGMTQTELAVMSGVTKSAISHYLLEERTAKIDVILNMAKVLECSVDELVYVREMVK